MAWGHERLVELVYDSVEGPREWSGVVAALAAELSADQGHLFLITRGGNVADTCAHGYDANLNQEYFQRFQAEDPRIPLGVKNLGRFMSDVEVVDSRAFEASALYNELLGPLNVRYTLFGMHQVQPNLNSAHAFMRPRSRGPFSRDEVSILQRLQPHISRALRLREVVNMMRNQSSDARCALDVVPVPLAIVDGVGRLLTANARAEAMLLNQRVVVLRDQRITASGPRLANGIAHALSLARQLSDPPVGRTTTPRQPPPIVMIERPGRRPMSLVFLPLRPQHALRAAGDSSSRVMIIFHDPDDAARLSVNVVAKLHALTPSEAALAVALAAGESLTQHASNVGCAEQTCRTHLKRILEKTGTHRQAELVHLLLGTMAVQMASKAGLDTSRAG